MTSPMRTALLVAAAMVVLYLVDVDLAHIEQHELAAEAASAFHQAETQSDVNVAIPLYRRALTLQRDSTTYQLALARTLVRAGRHNEASPVLYTVLSKNPNDGQANLEMARLLRSAGMTDSAAAYYHRSIYGSWPTGAPDQRQQVRLELAEMLARDHRNRDLLSELLLLDEYAASRPELQQQLAAWYLQAGSPSRAATEYRQLTNSASASPEAYAGLGDAELAIGDYRAAQVAYSNALRHGNKHAAEQLVLTVQLADLDPTQRRLSGAERLRRANTVLARAARVLAACAAGGDADELKARAAAPKTKEPTELLDLAEDVWRYATHACPHSASSDPVLRILMERLAQHP